MNLARLPFARLLEMRRAWMFLAWAAFGLAGAALARADAVAHGADRALLGAYGAIALPLLVYGVVSAALGGESLGRSGVSLVALGAAPARVVRATLLVAIVASVVLGAVLAGAVSAIAHGASDPPLVRDIASSIEVGAIGAAAYAAYFALGASFGARGFGRSLLLVADWVFGVGRGTSAILTPRAHLRSLLGGGAPLDMSARGSFVALMVLVLVCGGIALRRGTRATWKLPR